MPTNVHPDFIAAQAQYDNAVTDEERLKALELMRSKWPTHKGAEKLRSEIAGKIKKMKEKGASRAISQIIAVIFV